MDADDPNQIDPAVEKARVLIDTEFYDLAAEFCQSVLHVTPDHDRVRSLLGIALYHLDAKVEAHQILTDALRYDPDNPAVYIYFGRLVAETEDRNLGQRITEYGERLSAAIQQRSVTELHPTLGYIPVLWTECLAVPAMTEAPSESELPFLLTCEFWGDVYFDLFVNYCLESLLTSGNIPRIFKANNKSEFFLSLPLIEYMKLRRHPVFEELKRSINLRLMVVKHPHPGLGKYPAVSAYMNYKIDAAADEGFIMAPIIADSIQGDGSIWRAYERMHREGTLTSLVSGIRVETEPFSERLAADPNKSSVRDLVVSRRELVHWALAFMHPEFVGQNVAAFSATSFPSRITWTVPGQGLLARCFGLFPIVIHPSLLRRGHRIEKTFDADLIPDSLESLDEVSIITDSDEYFLLSLTNRDTDHNVPELRWFDFDYVRSFLLDREFLRNPINRFYAGHNLRYLTKDPDETLWEPVEREADCLIQKLLDSAETASHS